MASYSWSFITVRLADFIVANLEKIVQEWEDFAASIVPEDYNMTAKELRDHAKAILQVIAEDLRSCQTFQEQEDKSKGRGVLGPADSVGSEHGIDRLKANFTIELLVSEYRALRACVLRLWSRSDASAPETDLEDMTRFNEAIDQLVAASVGRFAQESRQVLEAEPTRRHEFLAMLAHELRNPLAPIMSAATLIKRGKGNEGVVTNASNIIERQVQHMAELVDELLDVSRVTRGLIELNKEALNLRPILSDAIEQAKPLMQARGHQLTVQESQHVPIVLGDRKRLVQIVTNLLTNAAKYTPNGGHIVLKMEVLKKRVVLTVRDNGIGMTPEVMVHLFEPFIQAKRTSDRTSGGLGLGLALVKNLTVLHGGQVTCTSAGLGKGSKFRVWLPSLQNRDEMAALKPRSGEPGASGKRVKVLIVDDNMDAAQALCAILTTAGHKVSVEHSSCRALDAAMKEAPDVCLLDIGLPEMDGNELVRRLRMYPEMAKTLFIAITGYGQPVDRDRAMASGFSHYMTKPVDLSHLLALLASVKEPE